MSRDYRFFFERLQCSKDVATLITKLCTVSANGRTHLPTGSSLSPILSYWTHHELFNDINALCASKGCTMTLYVDDITVSGCNASQLLLEQITQKIDAAGLTAHKFKIYREKPAKVTGVIVLRNGIAFPHSRARDIRKMHEELDTVPAENLGSHLSKLVGKLNEAQQFVPSYGELKKTVLKQHSEVWTKVVADRVARSRKALTRRRRKQVAKAAPD